MIVHFSKYHGTGNDFIMIDGRGQDTSHLDKTVIRKLCHRRFGIGGDGLIIMENSSKYDFRMRYFNADGREGTMCGNGGRCITAFARELGIIRLEAAFDGIDGMHSSSILPNGDIRLALNNVEGISRMEDGYLLDTGSPHFVQFVRGLDDMEVEEMGREIRYQDRFGDEGVNVNFVESVPNTGSISVRTYERGVEAETFSCGTGVTASAICSYYHFKSDNSSYHVSTLGGNLKVSFKPGHHHEFTDIFLTGPAEKSFAGIFDL